MGESTFGASLSESGLWPRPADDYHAITTIGVAFGLAVGFDFDARRE